MIMLDQETGPILVSLFFVRGKDLPELPRIIWQLKSIAFFFEPKEPSYEKFAILEERIRMFWTNTRRKFIAALVIFGATILMSALHGLHMGLSFIFVPIRAIKFNT